MAADGAIFKRSDTDYYGEREKRDDECGHNGIGPPRWP
jgi:hypothetical protein